MAASASADVMHKHLRSQLETSKKNLTKAKKEREINRNKNMQFELEVIELTEIVNNLKENVDSQRHDNFLKLSKQKEKQKEIIQQQQQQQQQDIKKENQIIEEYPPEIVIQQNLIRAQVEFYFSDYNLKRDKRLLEKICKEPQRGYLSVDEVLSLSRVRQLCNSPTHLYDSLKKSPYIHMILPDKETEEEKEKEKESEKEYNGKYKELVGE
eukprot:85789_1